MAARLHTRETDIQTEAWFILRDVNRKLAHLSAKDKSALAHPEWCNAERVIAEVFEIERR
jgi:hypothetical protein